MSGELQGRVVVISPHLDDAVLSLGALIAAGVRGGAAVEILTVFAGDPASETPSGPWDLKSGFTSEGHAARVRREEDRTACAILGATPGWLAFADVQYDRHGGEREIGAAVAAATAGADVVMLPGAPLLNPDHAWLSGLLLRTGVDCGRVALYAEQPYRFQHRKERPPLSVAASLRPWLQSEPVWRFVPAGSGDRDSKHRAALAYRSQLRQLGLRFLGLRRLLRHEHSRGGEAIAWL